MRLRVCLILILGLCLVSLARGQEIKLVGPDGPIETREPFFVEVLGIAENELPRTTAEISPAPKGTVIRAVKTFAGQPLIEFWSKNPGSYRITVAVASKNEQNAFAGKLVLAVEEAIKAAPSEPLVAGLKTTAEKIADKYPYEPGKSGSCVIEVVQPGPPPPPPPPPPPAEDEPSAAAKAAAAPILEALRSNKAKAERLAFVYAGMVQVVKDDNGTKLTTTGKFAEWHTATLRAAPGVSEPPMVGTLIDKAIAAVVGVAVDAEGLFEDRSLRPAEFPKILDALRGIAWACREAAR